MFSGLETFSYDFFTEFASHQPSGIEGFSQGEYILVTIHKLVNINSDEVLKNLTKLLSSYPRDVVFILHPRCQERLKELGLLTTTGVKFYPAFSYGKMISAMKGCAFIITDSGGLQREASYLKKRCLVRRETLGWSGLISAGINRLVGRDLDSINEGLLWAEKKLKEGEYDNFEDFIREDSCGFALNKLVDIFGYPK